MSPGIEFKKGESKFSDKSKATIDQLGQLIERYPDSRLTVVGFDADKTLAEERAKAVVKYLSTTFRVKPENIQVKAGDPAKQLKNSAIGFEMGETNR